MQAHEFTQVNPKNKPEAPMGAQVIILKFPLTADGMIIETLTMRRPLVRDRLIAEKANGSEIEKEIRLIANLCDMAPQHIELLDLSDYQTLQERLADFLS
ncbi:phage tail assembly protein [Marinibactrum halimedae]|uniref:Phage tail assembly protein n=1 Tax=Marinibactrum halimedae TaxID=1444977 RepID=A0AA37TDW8_9GAMM|nr:phage tail assembly protein [Marinibactrum halimedae]MCD9460785.1 phage tail assembly protein [Marinibactrum halimedae]GLS27372.1 hypothetical protein GCM10007877_30910 [Marinibactrum halimedae]